MKNIQKILSNMEMDQRTLIGVSILSKFKVPTSFPPLIAKHKNSNQTCTTNVITALDEVKATDPEDIDYDFYHNIVEKRITAKDEYQARLEVGEPLLKLS